MCYVARATAQPVALALGSTREVGSSPDPGQAGAEGLKTGADYTFFN